MFVMRNQLARFLLALLIAVVSSTATAATIGDISATYGAVTVYKHNKEGKCPVVTNGNATDVVSSKCDGKQSCLYTVDVNTFPGGDPAFGCWKNFVINYSCSGEPGTRTIAVGGKDGEANTQSLYLSCEGSNGIQVKQATFGGKVVPKWNSCSPAKAGNWTNNVKASCNGLFSCNFLVEVVKYPADDPAPGCYKSFSVDYSCPDGIVRNSSIPANDEGGANGKTASLECPKPAKGDIVVTSIPSPTTNNLNGVVRMANGRYVAVGDNGTNLYSDNGTVWTANAAITDSDNAVSPGLKSVAASSNLFVAVGHNSTPYNNLFWSTDGIHWNGNYSSPGWSDVAYPAGTTGYFIAAGSTSIWNPKTKTQDLTGYTIDRGTDTANSWIGKLTHNGMTLSGVAWHGNSKVVVGSKIISSINNSSWETRNKPVQYPLRDVTWGESQFIAVGVGGGIVTSPDGVTWAAQTSGTLQTLTGVACSGGSSNWCVAVGQNVLLTSTDGVSWDSHPSLSQPGFTNVAWTEGQFTVVGQGGKIWSITNP